MRHLLSIVLLACAAMARGEVAAPLQFKDLLVPSAKELKISSSAQSLVGKRAQVVGFMVDMEQPPKGGFYIAADPIANDESGNGTGDLPPNAIFVVVRSKADDVVPLIRERISVTGIFEAGYREEPDGRATMLRLILDRPEDVKGYPPDPAPGSHSRKSEARN
jgi:hypothetical protein